MIEYFLSSRACWGSRCRRFQKNELSNQRIGEVADYCLRRQGNRAVPWNPMWGSYLETARAAGKLSDERWTRYATHAFNVNMSSDPTVRVGSPLTLWVYIERSRVTGASFAATVSWANVSIDHSQLPTPRLKLKNRDRFISGEVQWRSRYEARIGGDVTRDFAEGARDISASIILTLGDDDKQRPTLGRYRYDVRTACEFQPAGYSRAPMR